jgi:predicted transglutaminase-like cysteine proteinase
MFRVIVRAACVTLLAFPSFISFETPARAEKIRATFATVGEPTSIPYGWVDFCARQPQECNQPPLNAQNIALGSRTWETLKKINVDVNAAIEPISNLEHWGTILDHWDYPIDGKGDCKI